VAEPSCSALWSSISLLSRESRSLVHRLRWLGAVVAVCGAAFIGVTLTVVAPGGAREERLPHIDYCHLWPGQLRVHWNLKEIRSFYPNADVIDVKITFDPRQTFPPFDQHFEGNENYVSDTNIGATRVQATLYLGSARFVNTEWANCT
jgi:hypothetical protein